MWEFSCWHNEHLGFRHTNKTRFLKSFRFNQNFANVLGSLVSQSKYLLHVRHFYLTKMVRLWDFFASQPMICWFHGSRIISAVSNLVFWTFFRVKTCGIVCHSYCFCYSATNMALKNVQKNTYDSTFEMIRLQPIRKQENNRKTFERASVEPTRWLTYKTGR